MRSTKHFCFGTFHCGNLIKLFTFCVCVFQQFTPPIYVFFLFRYAMHANYVTGHRAQFNQSVQLSKCVGASMFAQQYLWGFLSKSVCLVNLKYIPTTFSRTEKLLIGIVDIWHSEIRVNEQKMRFFSQYSIHRCNDMDIADAIRCVKMLKWASAKIPTVHPRISLLRPFNLHGPFVDFTMVCRLKSLICCISVRSNC